MTYLLEHVFYLAMADLSSNIDISENRLAKKEFLLYMDLIRKHVAEDYFDRMIDHMKSNLERSAEERHRGEIRKKWLQQVAHAGRLSGISSDPLFKAAFAVLQKVS